MSFFRSMSTGEKEKPNSLMRTGSNPNAYSTSSLSERKIADLKIAEFGKYLYTLNEGKQAEEEVFQEDYVTNSISFGQNQVVEGRPEPSVLFLSYFIGRCNPPHNGHIAALKTLLNEVKKNGSESKALILLGSGPGQQRTMDNPISFELKQEFIRHKLKAELGITTDTEFDSLCEIQKMKNPFSDVPYFVRRNIEGKDVDNISAVRITHYAGDKDEDSSKLVGVGERSVTTPVDLTNGTKVVTNMTEAISPTIGGSEVMSATRVRQDAYTNLTKEEWLSKYGEFYGPEFSEKMYNEIKAYQTVKFKKGGKRRKTRKNITKRKRTRRNR